jgi:hypothetical protein
MQLIWEKFTAENVTEAQSKSYCLYVFHHVDDGDNPFYIGKAKYFGPKQSDGYKASARYNSGYQHLLVGMLRSGFSVYIAEIGPEAFVHAEEYEQELIAQWNPVRLQKVKTARKSVQTEKPWNFAASPKILSVVTA